MSEFLVEVACDEWVIRSGPDWSSVWYPDPLGCLPVSVMPMEGVRLKGPPWVKDGELRCDPAREAGEKATTGFSVGLNVRKLS